MSSRDDTPYELETKSPIANAGTNLLPRTIDDSDGAATLYKDVESVVGPTDDLSYIQQLFVVLRPNWTKHAKQFVRVQEVSGAFGDIGTFLPLLTALAVGRVDDEPQLEFGPALFFAGCFTVLLSTYFNVPIPVQPMKTIASVAIAEHFPRAQILAAGILAGACVFILAATNLITVVAKYIPLSVVRGIQLGVGLKLMLQGVDKAYVKELTLTPADDTSVFSASTKADPGIVWFGMDSVLVSIMGGLVCVVFIQSKRVPVALVLFTYGIIIAIVQYFQLKDDYHLRPLSIGPTFHAPIIPTAHDFQEAFIHLFLPQIALTLTNSVVALERLAKDLFPNHDSPASVRRVCFSIFTGDFILCWFGMIPVCHGSGGLASQYAFGARSNLSMLFLGIFKLFFALLFGSSCLVLLQTGIFPSSVLGVLLLFAGASLAGVGMKIDSSDTYETLVVLMTATTSMGLNTGAGFLVGIVAYGTSWVLQHFQWLERM